MNYSYTTEAVLDEKGEECGEPRLTTTNDLKPYLFKAAGQYLSDMLPENFFEMKDGYEQLDFIRRNTWQPFEYEDPSCVWDYIFSAASSKLSIDRSQSGAGNWHFVTLNCRYGEHEQLSKFVVNTEAEELTEADLRALAKFEKGSSDDDWDENLGGYWFDGNLVCPGNSELIKNKKHIIALKKYLTVVHLADVLA